MVTKAVLFVENFGIVSEEICLVIEEVARMGTLHKFDVVVFLATCFLPTLDLLSPKL